MTDPLPSSDAAAAAAAPPAPSLALEFQRVSKWYGAISALSDVSLRIGCEIVGLVGRSGVGKSTLMKLAVGLLQPSQGSVRICGIPADRRAARAEVGFCPDTERLLEPLSGVQFVAWMLRHHGFSLAAARDRARTVLADLGLASHMERPIREYSKGMRQRVRLAQALAHGPRFVLLDEPMTGLDPIARRELIERIRALPAHGVGVLVSSHVLQELQDLVDRVVMLHQGRVLAEGRVAELRDQLPRQPHRVRVVAADPRRFAAIAVTWSGVVGVRLDRDAVEVSIDGGPAFYDALTELGATWPNGIQEVVALDDDLASVFGYLIG